MGNQETQIQQLEKAIEMAFKEQADERDDLFMDAFGGGHCIDGEFNLRRIAKALIDGGHVTVNTVKEVAK